MKIRFGIMVVLATMLIMAVFNAQAARYDEPKKPGDSKCPVNNVTIVEENGKATMTFRISGTYNVDYVLKDVWFHDKSVKYTKLITNEREFSITVAKDNLDKAWLTLSYVDPTIDPEKDKTGGGHNDVRLKVAMYYNHYKKSAEK